MQEILNKLYGYEYFGIYLIVSIVVLVLLFIFILFFGKKDQKEREIEATKKLSREVIEANIEKNSKRVDYSKIKNDVREIVGKYFYEITESKPMIITVIQEV